MPQKRLTQEDFIKRSIEVHGDVYDYTKTRYVLSKHKVVITCKVHGDFQQEAMSHLKGQGCIQCSRITHRLHETDFITRCEDIHGSRYDYSKVIYTTYYVPVIVVCKIHGHFEIMPSCHLKGRGCSKCAIESRANALKFADNVFTERAIKVHGDKYDYSNVKYVNSKEKVEIFCKQHNVTFVQSPAKHWAGQKCPKCSHHKRFSEDALSWLGVMEAFYKTNIKHIANGGEYMIPGTRYKADGYSHQLNIVFEYYGDAFHGNPKVYDCNKVFIKNQKTYGEMYEQTIKREDLIKSLGFNIVSIWERDWIKAVKAVVKLQRLYRRKKNMLHHQHNSINNGHLDS
jgi:hypothetical protein